MYMNLNVEKGVASCTFNLLVLYENFANIYR